MEVSTRITPSLRIRHLMVSVLYVAVALAAWRAAATFARAGSVIAVVAIVMFAPWGFRWLSALVLRPGPHRDWVVAFCDALAFLWASLFYMFKVLFLYYTGPNVAAKVFVVFYGATGGLILILGFFAHVRDHIVLKQCPRCGRKGLVHAARRWPRFIYCRCGFCDAEQIERCPVSSPACSKCGRKTLMIRRYRFAWCLHCHTRCKRLWRRPWEDATSSQDDRFFWRWELFGWLSHLGSGARSFRG